MSLSPDSTAVIILNYNGAEDTISCLRALRDMDTPLAMTIVVDNNSTDNSAESILAAWKEFASPVTMMGNSENMSESSGSSSILLFLPENGGYAAGNNAGIRVALRNAGISAIWILNNDTEPDTGALQALCDRLVAVALAGVAGSTVVYAHDKNVTQCAGGSRFNLWLGLTRALHAGEDSRVVRKLSPEPVESELWDIVGASMLIRRDVFDRVGFFREDFFLYIEETEFCIRTRKAGFRLAWAPESIVVHKEGGSTGARSAVGKREFSRPVWADYLGMRNRARLVRDHYPYAIPSLCCGYIGVAVNRVRRGQPGRITLVLKALWHGLAGRMGKPDDVEKQMG